MTTRQTRPPNPLQIMDEHVHLRHLLDEFGELLAARRATGAAVAAIFEQLQRAILAHFEHEEEGGYFAQALDAAPRLSERAAQLLAEHLEMAAELVALRNHARQAGSSWQWWEELNEMFNGFVQGFEKHEAEENTLLHEAYNVDIGAED